MGLGIFHRRTSMLPRADACSAPSLSLRVLVDSGPAARELFDLVFKADDTVADLRAAIAARIGLASMSLFKVSIPWQAHYEASAYAQRYGVSPSLLSVFHGYSMDDAAQLGVAGGSTLPYIAGSGSLRSKRYKPATLGAWFPAGGDEAAIDVLARTASSSSSMDWAQPSPTPLTLAAYIPGAGRHLVDISPDASITELKVQLLLAAGLPARVSQVNAISLSKVDMRLFELDSGRRYKPVPLRNPNTRVGDVFNKSISEPTHIDLTATLHPSMVINPPPPFTYPLPMHMLLPSPTQRRMLPPAMDMSSMESDLADAPRDMSHSTSPSILRCCAHEGGGGLVGLGITMSPVPSASSDHTCQSSDDEGVSWPTIPHTAADEWGADSPWQSQNMLPTSKHLQALFIPPTPLV